MRKNKRRSQHINQQPVIQVKALSVQEEEKIIMPENAFDFFQVKYCLTQRERTDRQQQAIAEFTGLGIDVELFYSIPADAPFKSFCFSQYAIIKKFVETGKKTLLTFEDDVVFRPYNHLMDAIIELPKNWNILYFGANITDGVFGMPENQPTKYSEHLCEITRAWTTHAVAYSLKAAEYIANTYNPEVHGMYDNWLSENVLYKMNCFIVNPMIAWQRPGKSDLWGCETDYTGCFIDGDRKMSQL